MSPGELNCNVIRSEETWAFFFTNLLESPNLELDERVGYSRPLRLSVRSPQDVSAELHRTSSGHVDRFRAGHLQLLLTIYMRVGTNTYRHSIGAYDEP
jgi:hypothetical protein